MILLGALSNTFGRDGLVVVSGVSFGQFRGRADLVVGTVETSWDPWVLVFTSGCFWGSSFSGLISASATVGMAMAYVVALGQ